MSLRNRLLLAAGGIALLSLLLSGALSWILVRTLEFDNAHESLDRLVLTQRRTVVRAECFTIPSNLGVLACNPATKLAAPDVFSERLRSLTPTDGVDRLLLVDRRGVVVYDSHSGDANGKTIRLAGLRKVDGQDVPEGAFQLAGVGYIGASAGLSGLGERRDPLGASRMIFARSSAAIEKEAANQLLPRLFLAGFAALLLALVVALLLSRAFAQPLSELAAAAEDVADGNYSRRVRISGRDEIGVVGVSFNRMAEAVEKARDIQREFLANVSHELKTPLTSLIGFSQAILDGSLATPREKERAAQIINEEAQRVLRMSQELLDLARVEGGQVPINITEVDLKALLEQEIEVIRPRAGERHLALELKTPERLAPLRSDPERLHQVIDNLLDNAVKYAPEGSPMRVSVENGLMNVEITVENAVGRNRPDPDRMFERFYRADPSRSSVAGGVGLGLAISRQLAAALGGRLWAELGETRLKMKLSLPTV